MGTTHGNISTVTLPLNGGVECRWGRQKSRFWAYICLHYVLWTVPAASAIRLAATDHGELVAGKWRSLLIAGNNDEVYDKKPQRYAESNVTQWQIWSLSNNNKRLRTSYYFVEANYWRTQSIARPLCNSRATSVLKSRCWNIIISYHHRLAIAPLNRCSAAQ